MIQRYADLPVHGKLDAWGYKYALVEKLSFSEIDWAVSRRNPARLDRAIDRDRVEHFACRMAAGDVFPAIVVVKRADGRYELLGGFHRCEAALLNSLTEFAAYVVVEADERRVDLLRRVLNSVTGSADSVRQLFNHAADVVELTGRSVAEVAKDFGLKKDGLGDALRIRAARKRGISLGVRLDGIADASVDRLYSLQVAEVFVRGVYLTSKYGASSTEVRSMVVDANAVLKEGGVAAQLAVLNEWEDRLKKLQEVRSSRKTGPALKFVSRLRAVLTIAKPGVTGLHLEELADRDKTLLPGDLRKLAIVVSAALAELERINAVEGRTVP